MRLSWLRQQHWSLYAAGAAAVFCLSTCSGPISRILHFREDHDPLECIVLVTGCDSGMGIIMVRDLLSRGYRVLALCLTIEGAERLYAENLDGGKVEALNTVVGDVTKQEDVDRVGKGISEMIDHAPGMKLWAVINNAGVAPCGFTDWLDMDAVKMVMDVNYFGVVNVTKTCLPYLKKTRNSRVINISSLAGLASGAHLGAYSASKHALEGWAKAFRAEVAPFGIHVCNVNSGFLKTPLVNSSVDMALRLYQRNTDDFKKELYSEVLVQDLVQRVKSVSENPCCVTSLVCDFLINRRSPPLRNFAGWQSLGMRFFLMLPQAWIDAAGLIMTPLDGVNRALIREMQGGR